MPTTGFHSVIDRPERVSRVIPPITTNSKISVQQPNSQEATGPIPRFGGAADTRRAGLRTAVAELGTVQSPASPIWNGGVRSTPRWQAHIDLADRSPHDWVNHNLEIAGFIPHSFAWWQRR